MGIRVRVPPQGGLLSWENFGKRVADVINELDGTITESITNPPLAMLRQTVAQPLTDLAVTPITFNVEDLDSINGHSTSVNPARWTCPTGYEGWYELSGGVAFVTSTVGTRTTQWQVNGTDLLGGQVKGAPAPAGANLVMPTRVLQTYLNVGDYVQLAAFQNSGGPLNTSVVGNEQSTMCVKFLRR